MDIVNIEAHRERMHALLLPHGIWYGLSIVWCKDVDLEDLVSVLGVEPYPSRLTVQDLMGVFAELDLVDDPQWDHIILLGRIEGWILIIDPGASVSMRNGVCKATAQGGTAIGLYWTINGHGRMACASNGELLVEFSLMFPDERAGNDVEIATPYLEGLKGELEVGEWQAAALLVLERWTGVGITQEWLSASHLAYTM
ncbi:DUF6461 domain-containing protein [Rhizohabitans arisaemae]|uniref:DUF6461 domain-containing protein n=1 Tax=Rhizohabitans arisaemae TaxID=2720610 RepID=UPI0024B12D67|nr:DUF6461 domain-containing protein [Rhizohabitans arisaemae]